MNHLEQEKKLCSDSRWAFDARNWSDGNATKKELKRRAFDASFACHQKWGSYSSPPRHLLALSLHSLIASNPFSLRLAWLLVQLLSAKPLLSSLFCSSHRREWDTNLYSNVPHVSLRRVWIFYLPTVINILALSFFKYDSYLKIDYLKFQYRWNNRSIIVKWSF